MSDADLHDEIMRLKESRNNYREKLRDARERLHQLRQNSSTPEYRQAKRQWVVRVNHPMLLISQVQRAGGTLLSRLFDAHPECFSHPMELKWGRPAKWNWPSFEADATLTDRQAFSLLDEIWVRKAIRHGGYSKYPQWAPEEKPSHRPRYPFVFDRALEFDLFADAFTSRRIGHRRDVLNAYLTALFNAWLDYQNLYATPKRWVTSFVPGLVTRADSLDRFFADYPDGILATIVRHPGSWFASASRHTFSGDVVEALQHWIHSTQASLAASARYGERVLVILFEDLVLNTHTTMSAICDRLGLTFHETLLNPTYNSMPVLSDSSFRLTTAIDPDVTQRYLTMLTPEQTSTIDQLAIGLYTDVAERYRLDARI